MARILISGASGLIGSALAASLEKDGDDAIRLVRRAPATPNEVAWDPTQMIDPGLVSGYDAIIHLSGENVAGRWTEAKKKRIRDSRVISTQNLARAIALAEQKPKLFLCASAIGHYGSRGDEILTEDSAQGRGFLPNVCREWEAATEPAGNAGVHVFNLRIGIVLSRNGGALKQMLLPFRLGLGGRIGNGRQWWSWIHVDDLVGAVQHIVRHSIELARRPRGNVDFRAPVREAHARPSPGEFSGPVNLVSPNPVTNREFTAILSGILHRPALVTMPALAARLAFGEFAEEGLLASARVLPARLLENGFGFQYPDLPAALGSLLG